MYLFQIEGLFEVIKVYLSITASQNEELVLKPCKPLGIMVLAEIKLSYHMHMHTLSYSFILHTTGVEWHGILVSHHYYTISIPS